MIKRKKVVQVFLARFDLAKIWIAKCLALHHVQMYVRTQKRFGLHFAQVGKLTQIRLYVQP
jgi:hypothetical protein